MIIDNKITTKNRYISYDRTSRLNKVSTFSNNLKKFLYVILIFFLSITVITVTSCEKKTLLEIHIIDVEQGDSSLIISPDGKSMLIDAGEEEYSRNVIRELKKSNLKKIDYIIGTHYDSDHIGGIDKVTKKFDVGEVLLPDDKKNTDELMEIFQVCNEKNIAIKKVSSGDVINLGKKTKIYILSPGKIYDEANQNSIVFLMNNDSKYYMFTGDADSEIENEIMIQYKLPRCEFLKVGHHGSKTSSCDKFISEISPKISTISCGYKNSYGHPHKEVLSTLKIHQSKIYRTDINGTMTFYFDKSKIYTSKPYTYE